MDRLIKNSENENWCAFWQWSRIPSGRTNDELVALEAAVRDFRFSDYHSDVWNWNLNNNGRFITSVLNKLIDTKILSGSNGSLATMRNNLVPQKLGIFIWRSKLNRLPVLSELDKRGVDLDSVLCPICSSHIETSEHILFQCTFAVDIWSRVSRWWSSNPSSTSNYSALFSGTTSSSNPNNYSKLWQAIEWITGYLLWKNRNNMVFKKKKGNGPLLLSEIQIKSFEWISNRSRKLSLTWLQWLTNPSSFNDIG
ncbi:uncharacterized protein [Rutidosis leptorrhynchoides]|uniref:uncharacterized protein n=1 Tax=Rutidosis leptorrhynchoides TaxID=125765 RepID=UPI003A9A4273